MTKFHVIIHEVRAKDNVMYQEYHGKLFANGQKRALKRSIDQWNFRKRHLRGIDMQGHKIEPGTLRPGTLKIMTELRSNDMETT